MRVPTPSEIPAAPPADTSMAKWRGITEAMIFSAPYGTDEFLRICDRSGKHYNRDAAIGRCVALAKAVMAEPIHASLDDVRLHHCHAANDSPTFRARYGHLLPKRPTMPSLAERRTGISDDQRMADGETAWDGAL